MKVAFRANHAMSDLSAHTQSGGERAVSTIMYLMALHEMTASPFRVVDEINQGMDERNERLVFDRIVSSCCGDGEDAYKPQYFLVSPKLLQGLRAMDHKDVTVLMIWNGPGVTYQWHRLSDIIPQMQKANDRKKRLLGLAADEDILGQDSDDSGEDKKAKTAKRMK